MLVFIGDVILAWVLFAAAAHGIGRVKCHQKSGDRCNNKYIVTCQRIGRTVDSRAGTGGSPEQPFCVVMQAMPAHHLFTFPVVEFALP